MLSAATRSRSFD